MKSCPKAGIKIHEQNESPLFTKQSRLSNPVSYHKTTMNNLDLDIENYSLQDLYRLFNINDELNEETMKLAKQIVLKMHPDKSRLDAKYFIFFSKAYKILFNVYEFQNKSSNKKFDSQDYFDESNKTILDNVFKENKEFKNPNNFNRWFNEKFEQHRIDNPHENGYGEWLKSNDDFLNVDSNVTKNNMNEVIEEKKRQIQAMTVYTGITDNYASTFGGTLLSEDNIESTNNYTDLRQAYTQTLIPVTMDDYEKVQKFNNVSEYKKHRDNVNITPLSQEESNKRLIDKNQEENKKSAALAYRYIKESEQVKKNQQNFWSDLKQLTGF